MQDKAQLRRSLRLARMRLTRKERQYAEIAVRRALKPWLRRNKKVGIYLAVGSELNIESILQDALKHRCQLYTPYIERGQRRLWFTPYPARNQRGSSVLNIMQYEGKKCRLEQLDIVLMPLIGIDQNGMRLGQGGGFYDTSLAYTRHRQPLRIGIGFAVQQCESIPHEAHDEAIDAYISEQGTRFFSRRIQARF